MRGENHAVATRKPNEKNQPGLRSNGRNTSALARKWQQNGKNEKQRKKATPKNCEAQKKVPSEEKEGETLIAFRSKQNLKAALLRNG